MFEQRPLRLLFSSYHSLLDPSSGAANSLRDLFQLMTKRGLDCQVFCGAQLDCENSESIPEMLHHIKLPFKQRSGSAHGMDFVLYNTVIDGTPTALYETPSSPATLNLTERQGKVHVALFEKVLEEFQPDVMLTYGGHIMAHQCMALARQRGVKVAFWLRNTLYDQAKFFEHACGALVPSTFCAEYYRRTIGLNCAVIPSALEWGRLQCEHIDRRCLTFVNPKPYKGVYVFAAIVRELTKRRPDIPMLVVDSHGGVNWLEKAGVELESSNVTRMTTTRDPRKFYSITRVLLAPSLWQETFGRVAAESMINGIPVLASRRGGLGEVVGEGGYLFDLPEKYTAQSRVVPKADEVKEIIDTIIRLWDDDTLYEEACLRARNEAEKWQPELLADQYEAYFRSIV